MFAADDGFIVGSSEVLRGRWFLRGLEKLRISVLFLDVDGRSGLSKSEIEASDCWRRFDFREPVALDRTGPFMGLPNHPLPSERPS